MLGYIEGEGKDLPWSVSRGGHMHPGIRDHQGSPQPHTTGCLGFPLKRYKTFTNRTGALNAARVSFAAEIKKKRL